MKPGPNSWSLSELMHAVVILSHYHCLSGFAHGCALNAEIDTKHGHIMRPLSQVQLLVMSVGVGVGVGAIGNVCLPIQSRLFYLGSGD